MPPSAGTYDDLGNVIYTPPIYGIMENDFSMDIHGLYSSVDSGGTAAAQQMGNLVKGATGGANVVVKSVLQLLQRFDGHSAPVFTVPIIIVKYKPSIDVLGIVSTLQSAPAGTYDGITIKAPYNYGFGSILDNVFSAGGDFLSTVTGGWIGTATNTSAVYQKLGSYLQGTWTLKISDWFIASGLILTSVSSTISKEVVKGTSSPLYARLNCTFTTAVLPDARTIRNWIIPEKIDSGNANGSATGAVGSW